jgi:hypothetical protein
VENRHATKGTPETEPPIGSVKLSHYRPVRNSRERRAAFLGVVSDLRSTSRHGACLTRGRFLVLGSAASCA